MGMNIEAVLKEDTNLNKAEVEKIKAIVNAMSFEEKKIVAKELDPQLLLGALMVRFSNMEQREQMMKTIMNV